MCHRRHATALFVTTILLASVAAGRVAATRPATEDDHRQAVREALRGLGVDADRGDVAAVMRRLWTGTPDALRMAEPVARMMVAGAAVRLKAIERFGPDVPEQDQYAHLVIGLPDAVLLDALEVTIDPARPDRASIHPPGAEEEAGEPALRRDADGWKLDPSPDTEGSFDPAHAHERAFAVADALEQAIPRMTAEAVQESESPIDWAAEQALGAMMGGRPLDAAAIDRLRKAQNEQQPARAARAAKVAALRAVKPIVAPAGDATDRREPLAVAKAYATAVAAGDVERAASYVARPDESDLSVSIARAMARQAVGDHRVRAAAVKQIGEAEALRLPRNDAGTFFIDRFRLADAEAGDDAARRVVTWPDNFPTAENPEGTPRDLDMLRVGDRWGVAAWNESTDPIERYGTLQELRSARAGWLALEKRIDAGELKTFDAINGD